MQLNTLHHGDCLHVLPTLPARSVDMILCDLPYKKTRNAWDSIIPIEPLWRQYRRILRPGGVVALTACEPFASMMIVANMQWYRYSWIWAKNKASDFMNAKRKPLRIHEDVLIFYPKQPVYHPQFTESTPYVRWNTPEAVSRQTNYGQHRANVAKSDGKRYPTTIQAFDRVARPQHSTEKPVDLGRYFIRTYTNPGAIVLDNAFGSGTFLAAAVMEGRNFIGIEKYDVIPGKRGLWNQFEYTQARLRDAYAYAEANGMASHLAACEYFTPNEGE